MVAPLLRSRPAQAPSAGLALIEDEVTREIVRQAVRGLGWPDEAVRPGGVVDAVTALGQASAPPLLVVDVSRCGDIRASLEALAEVCEPQTRVVVVGQQNDVGLYRALIAMGVADYLVKPLSAEQLLSALQSRPAVAAVMPEAARPIASTAVIGSRGGVGATSLVGSLGWLLAQEHRRRTVLLDLDLQFGALALSMDIEPGRGLREILASPDRIDSLLVGSASVQVDDRLRVLAAEEPLDAPVEPSAEGLGALFEALNGSADAVLVDVPRRLDPLGRAALAEAEVRVIVTDLTLAGLRDARRLRGLVQGLGAGEVLLVGARVGGAPGEVPRAEFERSLGSALDAVLPVDEAAALAACEQAKTLAEAAARRPLGQELRRLAARLAGGEAEPARSASWIRKLLGS